MRVSGVRGEGILGLGLRVLGFLEFVSCLRCIVRRAGGLELWDFRFNVGLGFWARLGFQG